jgi:hypothetical protein
MRRMELLQAEMREQLGRAAPQGAQSSGAGAEGQPQPRNGLWSLRAVGQQDEDWGDGFTAPGYGATEPASSNATPRAERCTTPDIELSEQSGQRLAGGSVDGSHTTPSFSGASRTTLPCCSAGSSKRATRSASRGASSSRASCSADASGCGSLESDSGSFAQLRQLTLRLRGALTDADTAAHHAALLQRHLSRLQARRACGVGGPVPMPLTAQSCWRGATAAAAADERTVANGEHAARQLEGTPEPGPRAADTSALQSGEGRRDGRARDSAAATLAELATEVGALSEELAAAAGRQCTSAALLSDLLASGTNVLSPPPLLPPDVAAALSMASGIAGAMLQGNMGPGSSGRDAGHAAKRVRAFMARLQVCSAADLGAARAAEMVQCQVEALQRELASCTATEDATPQGPLAPAAHPADSSGSGVDLAAAFEHAAMAATGEPNDSKRTSRSSAAALVAAAADGALSETCSALLRKHQWQSDHLRVIQEQVDCAQQGLAGPWDEGKEPAAASSQPPAAGAPAARSSGSRGSFAFGTPMVTSHGSDSAPWPSASISFSGFARGSSKGGTTQQRPSAASSRRRRRAQRPPSLADGSWLLPPNPQPSSGSGDGGEAGSCSGSPVSEERARGGSPVFQTPSWLARLSGHSDACTQTEEVAEDVLALVQARAEAAAAAARTRQLEGRVLLLQQRLADAELRTKLAEGRGGAQSPRSEAVSGVDGAGSGSACMIGGMPPPSPCAPAPPQVRDLQERIARQAARIEQLQLKLAATTAAATAASAASGPASLGSGSLGSPAKGSPISGFCSLGGSAASTPAKSPRRGTPSPTTRCAQLPLFPPLPLQHYMALPPLVASPPASPVPGEGPLLPPGARAPSSPTALETTGSSTLRPPLARAPVSSSAVVVGGASAASPLPLLSPRATGPPRTLSPMLSPRCTMPPRSPVRPLSPAGSG